MASRVVLPSGLRVLHESVPHSTAVSYQLWVGVGSADEGADEVGAAHVLEHMLFKGTEERDAVSLNDEVENLGGNMNAYTTFDQTVYHLTLSNRFWREGLTLFLDMMFHPLLDEEELTVERQVILEELREGDDVLDMFFGERFFNAIYPHHGYGRPVIGTADSIRAMPRETVSRFYRKWYRPENMLLTVAGDVDWHALQFALREATADLQPVSGVFSQVGEPTFPSGFNLHTFAKGTEERILELAFPIPDVRHDDIPKLDVLSYILGEVEVSRLYRSVRLEKKLARSIGTSLFVPRKPGRFLIRSLPYQGGLLELVREIAHQIRLVQSEEVLPRELHRAKLALDKELIFNDETTDGRAKAIAYYETVFGSTDAETKYRESILSVTERQIREVAQKYLNLDQMAMGLLLPKDEPSPSKEDLEQALRAGVAEGANHRNKSTAVARVQRFRLDSGLRILVYPIKGSKVSAVYASSIGGLWGETLETQGISNLIAATMDRGTAIRTDERIGEELAMLQGDLDGIAGRNSLGLRMDVVSANLMDALHLFNDVLVNPAFSAEVLEQEKTAILQEIEAQKDYFELTAANLFLQQLFPGHPYGLNPVGTATSVRNLTPKIVKPYYASVAHPSRMVLVVVGDVDVSEIKDVLTEQLASFEPATIPVDLEHPLQPLTSLMTVRRPIQGEKAYLQYGFRGPTYKSQERFAVEVLAGILASSGGGRLYVRLREELGLAYSVDASWQHGLDAGFLAISLNTAPDRADEAFEEVRKELTRVVSEGVASDELNRVKNYLIGAYELELQRNGTKAAQLCLGELYDTDRDLEDYVRGIQRVTQLDVKKVAETYLVLDKGAYVLLSPAVN